MHTGHVRWRVQRFHRDHRPVAFWIEIAACVVGLLVFAGLMVAILFPDLMSDFIQDSIS
jgi:hypothetical protein